MPVVCPQLDHATVAAFLRQHLGAPVTGVRGLRGGELCTVFAYTRAGHQYVIRCSTLESGFMHDRLAYARFAGAGIPIPPISEIGRFGALAFAIAPFVPGRTMQDLPASEQAAVAPACGCRTIAVKG